MVGRQRGQMRRAHRDESRTQRSALQRHRIDRGPQQVHGNAAEFGVVGVVGVGVRPVAARIANAGARVPSTLLTRVGRAGTRSRRATGAERINAHRVLQHVGDIRSGRHAELAGRGEAEQRANQFATRGGRVLLLVMMRVLSECASD